MSISLRVLILEDNPADAELILHELQRAGFEPDWQRVDTEPDYLAHLEPTLDIILSDYTMPQFNALRALQLLRESGLDIPLIIVSGTIGEDLAVYTIKQGAADYLLKDRLRRLGPAVVQALEQKQLRNERQRAEDELHRLNAELERRVLERTEELWAINKQLHETLRKLEEDEEAGRGIQFQLLPLEKEVYNGFEFSRVLQPSAYLSGDFLDYFEIDENFLGFYFADVSGHGISSAFVTVLLKSFFSQFIEKYQQVKDQTILNPSKILEQLNKEICAKNLNKYLTIFYAIIDKKDDKLVWCNGGQTPFPIIFDSKDVKYIRKNSCPVGLFTFSEYQPLELPLPPEFIIMLFSDGILEILPQKTLKDKQIFLLSIINRMDTTINSIIEQLDLSSKNNLPDDITLLMVKRRR
jgi:sigma-B regulation protein RsbU (phosphoserine phosphatase)